MYIPVKNSSSWVFYIPEDSYNLNKKLLDNDNFGWWQVEHLLHRLDGPSIEFNQSKFYYINGKQLDYEDWLKESKRYEFKEKFNKLIE